LGLGLEPSTTLSVLAAKPPQASPRCSRHQSAGQMTLTLLPRCNEAQGHGRTRWCRRRLDPQNGNILAMYSNPTYNPPATSSNYTVCDRAWKKDKLKTRRDSRLGIVATQQTSRQVRRSKSSRLQRRGSMPNCCSKHYRSAVFDQLPNTNKTLSNLAFGKCEDHR